jgi:CubicO group peptidase (beta-lactamase class C family)
MIRRPSAKALILSLTFILINSGLAYPQTPDFAPRVDAVFAPLDKKDSPGCALAVVQHGKIVYKRGYGMANLDYNLPNTPATNFYIASSSKQFTAFSIALLERQGKLSLDDPVTKYFPELPASVYGPVVIRQLIHHTNGIPDYFALLEIAGRSGDDRFTQEDFLDLLARQKTLNFKPGDQFLYSNSGYLLLAMLVERVSGKSLRQFTTQNIFDPLGMRHTFFRDDPTVIVPNRASGYSFENGSYKFHAATFALPGSGGLLTTVEDLFLWDQNFYHNKLGDGTPALLTEIQTPGRLNNRKPLTYAFGLEITDYKGLKMVNHAGASFGYRAQLLRFPEQEFSVICLCNSDAVAMSPDRFSREVADIYLSKEFKQQAASTANGVSASSSALNVEGKPIRVPDTELASRTGVFQNRNTKTVWRLFIKDDTLHATVAGLTVRLEPLTHTHFRGVGDLPVLMDFPAPEIKPKTITVTLNGNHSVLDAIDTVPLSAEELAGYAGEYYSDDVDATYKLYVDGGQLFVKIKNKPATPLTPLARDQFEAAGNRLNFERDASGKIARFGIDAGRAANVHFEKRR